MTTSPRPASAANDEAALRASRTPNVNFDAELRDRILAVEAERAAGSENFGPSRPMIVEVGIWVLLAAAIWTVSLLVWS